MRNSVRHHKRRAKPRYILCCFNFISRGSRSLVHSGRVLYDLLAIRTLVDRNSLSSQFDSSSNLTPSPSLPSPPEQTPFSTKLVDLCSFDYFAGWRRVYSCIQSLVLANRYKSVPYPFWRGIVISKR